MKINQEFKAVSFAITFLTRIPLPFNIEYNDKLPSKSLKYFPLIGLLLGSLLIGLYNALKIIWPPALATAVLLAIYIYLTGAIHLDGLLDSVDGLFSNRPREKILLIMKDSLNGSFATVTAVIYLLIKFILFYELIDYNYIFLFFPIYSRWLVLFAIKFFPRAEASSLGEGFDYQLTYKILIRALILPAIIIILGFYNNWLSLIQLITVITLPLIITVYISKFTTSKIGGLTGDIYGMINEIGELMILLGFLSVTI